jgi:redox-sensitive bicupin YhaK (pirin superfamily)
MNVRRASERGQSDLGWLNSHHTFSFADYYDSRHMGHGVLRVINDDRVAPGKGFGTHPHRDMEIISYVLDGALEHRDSMGNGSVIRPGDVQRMSAGTGVTHSEFNHSADEPVHFLQIWIIPDAAGHAPGYEQKNFPEEEKRGALRLVASRDGREGSVSLNQDADFYAGVFDGDESAVHEIRPQRDVWVHVATGSVKVDGVVLEAGDGAAINDAVSLKISDGQGSEVLVFDMARAN